MRNRIIISGFIIILGIFSCENNNQAHNEREDDRAGALGIQGTEIEETSNSSQTFDPGRTDPVNDTVSLKEQEESQ